MVIRGSFVESVPPDLHTPIDVDQRPSGEWFVVFDGLHKRCENDERDIFVTR
jgi:hypothetical protein